MQEREREREREREEGKTKGERKRLIDKKFSFIFIAFEWFSPSELDLRKPGKNFPYANINKKIPVLESILNSKQTCLCKHNVLRQPSG